MKSAGLGFLLEQIGHHIGDLLWLQHRTKGWGHGRLLQGFALGHLCLGDAQHHATGGRHLHLAAGLFQNNPRHRAVVVLREYLHGEAFGDGGVWLENGARQKFRVRAIPNIRQPRRKHVAHPLELVTRRTVCTVPAKKQIAAACGISLIHTFQHLVHRRHFAGGRE